MYKKETLIRYKDYGIFKIIDIIERKLQIKSKSYYVMEAIYGVETCITTPVNNPDIREVLSLNELHELIAQMPRIEGKWIDDKRLHQNEFHNMIVSNNLVSLIQVMKSIYQKREEKTLEKKS